MGYIIAIIGGLVLRKIAKTMEIPQLLLYIVAGFSISYITDFPYDDLVRHIALIIVLLRSGLAIDVNSLKKVGRETALLSILPAICEGMGILLLSLLITNMTLAEAGMLGFMLAAVSPAVVIPMMLWLQRENIGTKKHIPTMIMTAASLDDIATITIFSMFLGIAVQSKDLITTVMMIPIELMLGVSLGIVAGKIFKTNQTIWILVISLLLGFSDRILPVSSLISVMTYGVMLSQTQNTKKTQKQFEMMWIVAEMVLFAAVGSMISISTFVNENLVLVILILGIGTIFRIVGIRCSIRNGNYNEKERQYITVAYLPKATVQAALAAVPLAMGMPYGNFIFVSGISAILISTPLATLFLRKKSRYLMD